MTVSKGILYFILLLYTHVTSISIAQIYMYLPIIVIYILLNDHNIISAYGCVMFVRCFFHKYRRNVP